MSDGTKSAQQKERLKAAIATLAMELEIKEGRRFNIYNGAEEVAKVLKFALPSHDEKLLDGLRKVVSLLSSKQIEFFKSKGINLDLVALDKRQAAQKNKEKQEVVYRGKTKEKPLDEDEVPEEHKGKKKIVYRGQVKWV
jgi:hypothetical protein